MTISYIKKADKTASSDEAETRKRVQDVLNEIESKNLVKSYKIPVVSTKLATSAKEARDIASKLKFPLVMKIVSNDISHKSDVGGVVLDVGSLKEVDNHYKSMMKAVKKVNKQAPFKTFIIVKLKLSYIH